jgi:hypothetical protein
LATRAVTIVAGAVLQALPKPLLEPTRIFLDSNLPDWYPLWRPYRGNL